MVNANHLSQNEQFAVTLEEVDALCQASIRSGAIGAHQNGGGFGRAIVALVSVEAAPGWWDRVSDACSHSCLICMGREPTFT